MKANVIAGLRVEVEGAGVGIALRAGLQPLSRHRRQQIDEGGGTVEGEDAGGQLGQCEGALTLPPFLWPGM